MSYNDGYERRKEAGAILGAALAERGWTVFGYKPDKSDSMTDYYDPAYWDGVAVHPERPGVVVSHRTKPATARMVPELSIGARRSVV